MSCRRRRWRRGAVACLVGLCALLAGCVERTDAPSDHRILPETRGRLESVALSLTSGRRAALRNADIVSRLVDALPVETRVQIFTNDRAAFEVRRARAPLHPRDVHFVEIAPDHELTIWPQDPFLVLESRSGSTRLLRSKRFERADDRVMAEALAEAAGWEVAVSDLVFEGGNLVADERRVFIGANTIRQNAIELDLSERDVARRFERELGRPVWVVGPVPQLVAHLDMFLTPLGDDRIALADPGLGAALAARALAADPEVASAFERRTRAWFFGDPRVESLPGRHGPLLPPDLEGGTQRAIEASAALAADFDALARALSSRGLAVERVPILLGGVDDADGSASPGGTASPPSAPDALLERPYAAALDFPILTYNNVIQEERDGQRSVWLPRYGLDALDGAATRTWESWGYRVVPVPGFATSALYGGALRCSAKVTGRSSASGRAPVD